MCDYSTDGVRRYNGATLSVCVCAYDSAVETCVGNRVSTLLFSIYGRTYTYVRRRLCLGSTYRMVRYVS